MVNHHPLGESLADLEMARQEREKAALELTEVLACVESKRDVESDHPLKLAGEKDMSIEQTVVEKLKTLPSEKQQEVLDFVEFLQTKTLQGEIKNQEGEPTVSALTLAQKWVGCVEGAPEDLSTNKKYLSGLGAE